MSDKATTQLFLVTGVLDVFLVTGVLDALDHIGNTDAVVRHTQPTTEREGER